MYLKTFTKLATIMLSLFCCVVVNVVVVVVVLIVVVEVLIVVAVHKGLVVVDKSLSDTH